MTRPIGTRQMPSPPTITIAGRLAVGSMRNAQAGAPASGTSPWSDAASAMLAFPFVLESQTTMAKAFWVNGSAAGGNSDVTIYDDAFARVTTTGSVAGSGNSVPQAAAFAFGAVTLSPGLYYCAMGHDATTTNQLFRWAVATTGIALWQSLGCWRQSGVTVGTTPSTATPGDITNVGWPLFGLITRTVFDV